jgi:hypothetical protein
MTNGTRLPVTHGAAIVPDVWRFVPPFSAAGRAV